MLRRTKLVTAVIVTALALAAAPAVARVIAAAGPDNSAKPGPAATGANPPSAAVGAARLLSARPASASRSGWSIQPTPNPRGPTGQLLFGTCTSASSCIGVGTRVTASKVVVTLAERWNGSGWHVQRTPHPAGARVSVLNGVACSAPSACTAVGDAVSASGTERTVVERWDGSRWRIQSTPNPAGSRQSFLIGVACASRSSCTAVGASVNSSGTQVNLAERWDGSRWRIRPAPNPAGAQFGLLSDVSCTTSSACTAVGLTSKGTLAERWNGSRWRIQRTPNPAQSGAGLLGVACTSSSSCTAVGASNAGTLAERWNGSRWRIQPSSNPPGTQFIFLNGVDCSSRSACTAVGGYLGSGAGDFRPVAERWNGTKWAVQRTPSPGGAQGDFLSGVACPSSSACTGFGFSHGSGTPLTMAQRWNGTRWQLQGTQNPVGAAETQLNSDACPSTSSCFAVGTAGPTLGITSTVAQRWNGTRWQNQPIPTLPGAALWAVSCASPSACVAAGGTNSGTLAERWDGRRWRIQQTPTSRSGGAFNAVSCTAASACTAVGGTPSKLLAERWNGKSWKTQPVPTPTGAQSSVLTGVSCPSTSTCTAVGIVFSGHPSGTLAERWNGSKWSIQPGPTSASAGDALNAVSCTSASACTAVGNTASMKNLAERWNGTHWTVQPTPSPAGAMGLSGVACSGPAACTAVGLTSTNLGGMVLSERWNGAKWQIQATPFIPALSVMTSSPPAVACPARSACTAVGGYEAPGPTSVTLAEQWNGNRRQGQPGARPSGDFGPRLSCAGPLAGGPLIRPQFSRHLTPTGGSLSGSDPRWITTPPWCRAM